jgi:hypothetical protein
LSNVKGFAAVIDWILIMNYDIWGCESTLSVQRNQLIPSLIYSRTQRPPL